MKKKTLEKLKQNPHYKISSKQWEEDREDMVEFGKAPLHNQSVEKHYPNMRRLQRTSKTVLE